MLGEIKLRATDLYVKSVKSSLCSSTQTLISPIWEFFHGAHSRDPSTGEQREAISYLMVGVGVVKATLDLIAPVGKPNSQRCQSQ